MHNPNNDTYILIKDNYLPIKESHYHKRKDIVTRDRRNKISVYYLLVSEFTQIYPKQTNLKNFTDLLKEMCNLVDLTEFAVFFYIFSNSKVSIYKDISSINLNISNINYNNITYIIFNLQLDFLHFLNLSKSKVKFVMIIVVKIQIREGNVKKNEVFQFNLFMASIRLNNIRTYHIFKMLANKANLVSAGPAQVSQGHITQLESEVFFILGSSVTLLHLVGVFLI